MTTASEASLARRLAEFERRLKAMERGDRLTRASIVVDDTGRSLGVTAAVVTGSREAALVAARALYGLIVPGDPAGISVWFTDSEPADAVLGDLWLQAALDPTLMLSSGAGVWAALADQTPAAAVAGLRSGLATDDGRIQVWSLPTAPAAPAAFGDLWLQADTVAYRWEGDSGWQPLVAPEGQSLNYVAGENGWTITPDGDSQFRDLSALGQVAGTAASFGAIQLGDTDLQTLLDQYPRGKVLEARKASGTDAAPIVNVEARLFLLDCGDKAVAGRTYRYAVTGHLQRTGTLAAVDALDFKFRYTLDGSDPTTTSPILSSLHNSWRLSYDGTSTTNNHDFYIHCAFDSPVTDPATQTLKILLTGARVAGTANFEIYQTASDTRGIHLALYDEGPAGVRNDAAAQQLLGITETTPITRRTKTFNALWAWGTNSAGSLLNDSYFYIGDGPNGEVGLFGLVGFDSAAIISGLAGLTTGVSCTLRWIPRTRKTSTGLDVRILTHNYASRTAASSLFGYPEMDPNNGGSTLTSRGTTANTVPGTPYNFSLGVPVLTAFRAGTIKGVGFVNSSTVTTDYGVSQSDGSGSIYGNGTSECQLVVVYDGTS